MPELIRKAGTQVVDCLESMQQRRGLGKGAHGAKHRRRGDTQARYSVGFANKKYNPPAIKMVTGRVNTQAMRMREIMP